MPPKSFYDENEENVGSLSILAEKENVVIFVSILKKRKKENFSVLKGYKKRHECRPVFHPFALLIYCTGIYVPLLSNGKIRSSLFRSIHEIKIVAFKKLWAP